MPETSHGIHLDPFRQRYPPGFAVAAPLGPTGITAIRQRLAHGSRTAFWIGMGAALTDLAYILATYAGLTPLLLRLPWLTPLLYGLGALVLGRMGFLAVMEALKSPALSERYFLS
ncbi:MAG: LysE family transporter [Chloroflexi bacterium]|nr:LysE family transporter [Chloroflexota bacterium]